MSTNICPIQIQDEPSLRFGHCRSCSLLDEVTASALSDISEMFEKGKTYKYPRLIASKLRHICSWGREFWGMTRFVSRRSRFRRPRWGRCHREVLRKRQLISMSVRYQYFYFKAILYLPVRKRAILAWWSWWMAACRSSFVSFRELAISIVVKTVDWLWWLSMTCQLLLLV